MKDALSERRKLLQLDLREHIEQRIGLEPWLTAYSSTEERDVNGSMFCGLVPNNMIADALHDCSWDLHIGDGRPGFNQTYRGGEAKSTYHRFGLVNDVEPFVLVRDFYGIKPRYAELIEEFVFSIISTTTDAMTRMFVSIRQGKKQSSLR